MWLEGRSIIAVILTY